MLRQRNRKQLPNHSTESAPGGGGMLARFTLCLLALCALLASRAATQTPETIQLLDLSERRVNPFDGPPAKALVFLFIRTDCPISNRYTPELQRLQKQFAAAGVRFVLVYASDEAAAIDRHLKEYGLAGATALGDPQHALVKLTGVTVTPAAAVFVPDNARQRLVYRGRIDDRVIAFGQQRLAPTQRDLEATLKAVLRGAELSFKEQPAVGCYISANER